jgi:hypothetical protein
MFIFKRLKDIDVAVRTHFIRVYCWVLFPFVFIMFFVPLSVPAKIAITLLGALAATVLVVFITSAIGGSAGTLYGGGRARFTLREQLEGELTRARVSKTNRNYEDALATLETILARDPDFSDALLLKAQVLWEGFADGPEARQCVMRILHHEKDRRAAVYRWAGELYKEINRKGPATE